ncbi:hypothetical protein HK099_004319 [Clydaea vesicula]|uniref:Uncharacterized protein n=1 Tax=Clydaea vesicula TaxID=447962 RepID=A0AAD5U708_9FUNG|nr:hypothetical protein HK099_004319 [Clydaea vesicula]
MNAHSHVQLSPICYTHTEVNSIDKFSVTKNYELSNNERGVKGKRLTFTENTSPDLKEEFKYMDSFIGKNQQKKKLVSILSRANNRKLEKLTTEVDTGNSEQNLSLKEVHAETNNLPPAAESSEFSITKAANKKLFDNGVVSLIFDYSIYTNLNVDQHVIRLPTEVAYISSTIKHIHKCSELFREGKLGYIKLSEISKDSFNEIINFLRYTNDKSCAIPIDENLPLNESFKLSCPTKELIQLVKHADYLNLPNLVELCTQEIKSNFTDYSLLADIPEEILLKILEKMTIPNLFITECSMLENLKLDEALKRNFFKVNCDRIWEKNFQKICMAKLKTIDRKYGYCSKIKEITFDTLKNSKLQCLEFYFNQLFNCKVKISNFDLEKAIFKIFDLILIYFKESFKITRLKLNLNFFNSFFVNEKRSELELEKVLNLITNLLNFKMITENFIFIFAHTTDGLNNNLQYLKIFENSKFLKILELRNVNFVFEIKHHPFENEIKQICLNLNDGKDLSFEQVFFPLVEEIGNVTFNQFSDIPFTMDCLPKEIGKRTATHKLNSRLITTNNLLEPIEKNFNEKVKVLKFSNTKNKVNSKEGLKMNEVLYLLKTVFSEKIAIDSLNLNSFGLPWANIYLSKILRHKRQLVAKKSSSLNSNCYINLKLLNISRSYFGGKGLSGLIKSLSTFNLLNLCKLDLSFSILCKDIGSNELCHSLKDFLKTTENLEFLNLSGNYFTTYGFNLILDGIVVNSSLLNLDFSFLDLRTTYERLSVVLSQRKIKRTFCREAINGLKSLILRDCQLLPRMITIFVANLFENDFPLHKSNCISKKSDFQEALGIPNEGKISRIDKFDLSCNNFDGTVAASFRRSLVNVTIREFLMEGSEDKIKLGDDSGCEMLMILKNLNSLKKINLNNQSLGKKCWNILPYILYETKDLTEFKLKKNHFSEQDLSNLKRNLKNASVKMKDNFKDISLFKQKGEFFFDFGMFHKRNEHKVFYPGEDTFNTGSAEYRFELWKADKINYEDSNGYGYII